MWDKMKKLLLDEFNVKEGLLVVTLLGMMPTTIGYFANKTKKLFMLWGLLIIFCKLVENIVQKKKPKLNSRYLLVAFLISYAISFVLFYDIAITKDDFAVWRSKEIKQYMYMILYFLLFTYVDEKKDKTKVKKEIMGFAATTATIILCYALFGFYTFFMNIHYEIPDPSSAFGQNCIVGIKYGRLYGFYDPNTGSTLSIISIMSSLLLLNCNDREKWKKTLKVFVPINIFLQYCFMVLTQSRTSIVTFSVFLAAYVILKNIRNLNFRKIAVAVAFLFLPLATQNTSLSLILNTRKAIVTQVVEEKKEENSLVSVREDTAEESRGGMLNGRVELWSAGIECIKKHPVFGVTRNQVYRCTKEYVTSKWLKRPLEIAGLHNGYMMVWVSAGTVGLVLYLLYFGGGLISILKRLIVGGNAMPNALALLTAFVISAAVHDCTESLIMFTSGFLQTMFWTVWGYAICIAGNKNLNSDTIN